MIKHEKLNDMAELDKFFAKAKLRLEDIQIVRVSTKMAGFYMVFYDDGLPYPEKGKPARTSTSAKDEEIVLTPVDKVQQGSEET